MADTSNLSNYLKDLADAIREKKGIEGEIPAANFDTEIKSIETGIDTSDADATAKDIISPRTAYVNGEKITGEIIEIKDDTKRLSLNDGDYIYYNTSDSTVIEQDVSYGKIAYGENGKIIGNGDVTNLMYPIIQNISILRSASNFTATNSIETTIGSYVYLIIWARRENGTVSTLLVPDDWILLTKSEVDDTSENFDYDPLDVYVYYKLAANVSETVTVSHTFNGYLVLGLISTSSNHIPDYVVNTYTDFEKSLDLGYIQKGDIIICSSVYVNGSDVNQNTPIFTLSINTDATYSHVENSETQKDTIMQNSRYTVFSPRETSYDTKLDSFIGEPGKTIIVLRNNGTTGENLLPENIKKGVSIFGVEGVYESPITQDDYDECLELSEQILGENVSL